MIVATLDANVLASAILGYADGRGTAPVLLLDALRRFEFDVVSSEHNFSEVESTLRKPFFRARIAAQTAYRLLAEVRRISTMVDPHPLPRLVTGDPNDDLVLATAIAGSAEYLVTGDAELLALGEHAGVRIVTATEFVKVLAERP